MSFPVKSSKGVEDIAGVASEVFVSVYADRVLVVVSHNGKPGTLIHTTRDRAGVSGKSTLTARVLLGKRDDFSLVVANKIADLVGKTCGKPVLVALNLPPESPEVFRGVLAAVTKHQAW